ncbi:MAG: LPXTG cell wall anchor domain-containing protein [Acutalibacteraceae bacterium]
MFKKMLCTILAVMMIAITCVCSVSAAEVDNAAVAADSDVSGSGTSGTVTFEVPSTWNNYSSVFCHIYEYNGDAFYNWKQKREQCKQVGDREFSYDLSNLDASTQVPGGLKSGKAYCIMFVTNTDAETAASTFDTGAIGAKFSCSGSTQENAVDSSKKSLILNCNKSGYGTVLQITSIGNIIGSALPYGYTKQKIYDEWVADESNIANAMLYGDFKNEAEVKSSVAKKLGVSVNGSSSSSPSSSSKVKKLNSDDYEVNEKGEIVNKKTGEVYKGNAQIVDDSGKVIASSNAASTGEGTTYLYIFAGVMLLAAAAFLFTRKRKVEE